MKLYLVGRRDLGPGLLAAQLCHALREFVAQYPETDREWYERSNTLVLLNVDDESALSTLAERAQRLGVSVATFREPDLNHALTALALGPEGRRLVRHCGLAFA